MGSVHGDERGFRHTVGFLYSFQPDLVLVELSPYGKVFRERHQRALQQKLKENLAIATGNTNLTFREALTHPEIKAIRRQLALPFEHRAARRFCQNTGSPLVLVDYSPFSRRMIRHWPELLSSGNLSSLLTLPEGNRPAPATTYELAARTIREEHPWLVNCLESHSSDPDSLWQKRERFMAARIGSALKRFRPRRAVYLGGWQHLTIGGSFPSLRELLGLEHASCCLLDRGFI